MINYETWCSLMQYLIKIFCLHLISIKKLTETKVDTWIPLRMQLGNVGGGQSCMHCLHQLGLQVMLFSGHHCVNFWCMIARRNGYIWFTSILHQYMEESTYIIDSLGRNLSLNLTHHVVGQIWSFSTPFVFHIALPVKHQLLIPSCLGLTVLTLLKYVLHHIQRVHRREDDSGRNA